MRCPYLLLQIFATLISFGTSAINVALLSAWRGHQHAWFCLLACSLDILINAIAIYWVTKPGEGSRNAEGFDTSLLLIRSRSSVDQRPEKTESLERKVKANVDPRQPMHDKDAYLKPQPNVYYPMGSGLTTYDDLLTPCVPAGLPPETTAKAPTVPAPIMLSTSRTEHDRPCTRCSTSDESGSSSRSRKCETRSMDGLERASSDAREMGFLDFLGEPPGENDGRAEECPRGMEEEGRFQKAFFRMLLGRDKKSSSGVCRSQIRYEGLIADAML